MEIEFQNTFYIVAIITAIFGGLKYIIDSILDKKISPIVTLLKTLEMQIQSLEKQIQRLEKDNDTLRDDMKSLRDDFHKSQSSFSIMKERMIMGIRGNANSISKREKEIKSSETEEN